MTVRLRYTLDVMVDYEPEDYENWFDGKTEIHPEDVLEIERQILLEDGPMHVVDSIEGSRFYSAKVELDK